MDDQGRALAAAHILEQPVQHFAFASPAPERLQALGGHGSRSISDQGCDPGVSLVRRRAVLSESHVVVTRSGNTTLTERVAIVTGGARGLGRAVAYKLASEGYAV